MNGDIDERKQTERYFDVMINQVHIGRDYIKQIPSFYRFATKLEYSKNGEKQFDASNHMSRKAKSFVSEKTRSQSKHPTAL